MVGDVGKRLFMLKLEGGFRSSWRRRYKAVAAVVLTM